MGIADDGCHAHSSVNLILRQCPAQRSLLYATHTKVCPLDTSSRVSRVCPQNCKIVTRTDDTGSVKLEDTTSGARAGRALSSCKSGPVSPALLTSPNPALPPRRRTVRRKPASEGRTRFSGAQKLQLRSARARFPPPPAKCARLSPFARARARPASRTRVATPAHCHAARPSAVVLRPPAGPPLATTRRSAVRPLLEEA